MRYLAILLFATFSFSSFAQSDAAVETSKQEGQDAEEKSDWKFRLHLGATADWTVNEKWSGATSGNYFSFGGKIKGEANYRRADHEWRNELSLHESFSKTPVTKDFHKAHDRLSFDSIYLWHFGGWWGAFGEFNLDTSLFPHDHVRKETSTFNIVSASGATTTVSGTSLRLTDPFSPLYLKETIGLFATPVETEPFTLEFKAGGQARENLVNGQRIITSESGNTVNVTTLANFYQFGPMAGTQIHGQLLEKMLSYKAGIEAMYVAFQAPNAVTGTLADRLNVNARAEVALRLNNWASLSWDFKAVRTPEIRKDFQLQSNLWLTLTYDL